MHHIYEMTNQAIDLLSHLISIPSLSREEDAASSFLESYLISKGIRPKRYANNIVAVAGNYSPERPTLMLNSHIDTVPPAGSYTRPPFEPTIEDGKLYGLGANDAGGSLVSLLLTFLNMQSANLPFNLLLALSAEEEVGGEKGMRFLLPALKEEGIDVDMAIVGEPTGMRAAVAERGLLVIDASTRGVAGHAARQEGVNAISLAIEDINRLVNTQFPKRSGTLGDIKISVTQIEAGSRHNIIPDLCKWVADVRTTDAYSNIETLELLRGSVSSHTSLKERSTRLNASAIPASHPLVKAAEALDIESFISSTTSDISQMRGIPALKIGPGESARSHSADEYIFINEIQDAMEIYRRLIRNIVTYLL